LRRCARLLWICASLTRFSESGQNASKKVVAVDFAAEYMRLIYGLQILGADFVAFSLRYVGSLRYCGLNYSTYTKSYTDLNRAKVLGILYR
jgi:hypothetical protein